jgi:hypothetical protein
MYHQTIIPNLGFTKYSIAIIFSFLLVGQASAEGETRSSIMQLNPRSMINGAYPAAKTNGDETYTSTPLGPASPTTPLWLPVFEKGSWLNLKMR